MKRVFGIALLIAAMIAVSTGMLFLVAQVRGLPAAVIIGAESPAGLNADAPASTLAPRGEAVAGLFTRQPIGATGVRMLLDCMKQVTNTAGPTQVDGAKRFAMLNVGGNVTTTASFVVGRHTA